MATDKIARTTKVAYIGGNFNEVVGSEIMDILTIYREHLALLDFQIEWAEKFNLPIIDELKVAANRLRGEVEVLEIINAETKQNKIVAG